MAKTQAGKSPIIVLREFFGYMPGSDLKGFKAETDRLSTAEKAEMADLAARELNLKRADDGSYVPA